jgi:hypothetical protein
VRCRERRAGEGRGEEWEVVVIDGFVVKRTGVVISLHLPSEVPL